jgi:hypothetical protein
MCEPVESKTVPIKLPITLPESLKARLFATGIFGAPWGAFRRWELFREYAARRDFYAAVAERNGLNYVESEVIAGVRERLSRRGYAPMPRREGQIHTFAFIPSLSWHRDLLGDLDALGPVTHFDYPALGFRASDIRNGSRSGMAQRKAMNDLILPALKEAHARRPVDWVFVYASGLEISAPVITRIAEETGIPTVNMCFDDKQSWEGRWMGDHRGGQVDIAAAFDLSWTSARIACEWYLAEGGRPVYMPEGFDVRKCRPITRDPDIPVSFVGSAYGFRPEVVRFLLRHGAPVRTYGPWWPASEWVDDWSDIARRSRINLGMGGIGFAENLTNVKTRDFEIPATAGGPYLTTYSSDLAQHYVVGDEILCYQSREELLDLIRYYLRRPEEASAIAERGRQRCLRQHRWLHRYQRVCQMLGILEAPGAAKCTSPF